MTDLTPERRAELRAAVIEDPSPMGSVWWPISGPSVMALLDAADERDRLAAVVERVRAIHQACRCDVCQESPSCEVCDSMDYPCATRCALDGTDEKEES